MTSSAGNCFDVWDAYGNIIQLMQVLAVGRNDSITSTKRIDGAILNPSKGSSSHDAANWRIQPNVMSPLLPAIVKKVHHYVLENLVLVVQV
jgi:hypothetical protein